MKPWPLASLSSGSFLEAVTSRESFLTSHINHFGAVSQNFPWPFAFVLSFFNSFILLIWVHCLQTHQKRAQHSITDGCEPACGCWDLNSGLSEEQSGALTHWAISPAWILYFLWLCAVCLWSAPSFLRGRSKYQDSSSFHEINVTWPWH